MSASISVEIKGIAELKKAFNKSPALFVRVFDTAVKKSTLVFFGKSREYTPVDKGFLRETGMQTTFAALIGRVDNVAPYAVYVHEGTKFMEGRPFFDHGVEAGQAEVDEIFDAALQEFNNQL